MSLAIYAAPFNNTQNTADGDGSIDFNTNYSAVSTNNIVKRRNTNNRTQKNTHSPNFNETKVNTILDAIHKSQNTNMDNNSNSLGDFKPLDPPISVGVENTKKNNPDNIESHNQDDDIDLHNLKTAYMDEKVANKYYSQFIPNYNPSQIASQPSIPAQPFGNDTLMNKLNYMIHLLEEKQDERTNNVTEEVILYSFLGIFMIFIVDSFVKVGKYVR